MYTVKYRQPGQWLWRRIRKTVGDGVEEKFRWFHKSDDQIVYISLDAEVVFPAKRQKEIQEDMSKEIGIQVQRA